jgi:hypothetical protein
METADKITPLQVLDWRSHPVTQRLFKLMTEAKMEHSLTLTKGMTLHHQEPLKQTAFVVGVLHAIDNYFFEAELNDPQEDNVDE